ncbi:TPA: DegT/DnrJ/EryC1/StrS aminotransferase family protein [Candidatus Poribacteria bacterium]|nr:DegT/DnrJ/EryC1/StrS aminotransferase family protein [Candidatus Poribacteria bacterium]HIB88379.1 DegT/DnrJ/EryC1/StrS aminotransferase family protein [Candidatus Poribacteria bacterium]HIC02951.1 DegT/DnrJ/EryC1/StrS aminotransferase family protein [Candidatus Poribacteria bacterium]HIM09618.1 DegT/DnrJ/EryC1/StrS aminotransferase family protein [Candidatus Poribacteria bacterium]HIO09159.1 DegT/DnrJ/EryC1/StrS aminotransferase family protein [Candidatus Poribacteria bacterium]
MAFLGIHLGEGIPNKLIPICRPWIGKEEIDAIGRVIDSKWISTGSKTAEFEQKFAEYIGVKHAIAVSSCTAALHLSLVAAGIESGDEIINPIHLLLQQKQSAMLMQFRYLWI